jgi:hypothetical protein
MWLLVCGNKHEYYNMNKLYYHHPGFDPQAISKQHQHVRQDTHRGMWSGNMFQVNEAKPAESDSIYGGHMVKNSKFGLVL